jgi:hypothetical protein
MAVMQAFEVIIKKEAVQQKNKSMYIFTCKISNQG